jgi:hypothetical protein
MNLRIGGTFSYTGEDTLVILKIYLKGTTPKDDPLLKIDIPGTRGRFVQTGELHLSRKRY